MTSFYEVDPDYEPDDQPAREPQPDDFCECRPGAQMRHRSQHRPECLRWAPPLTGTGSNPDHRARALAYIREQIVAAKTHPRAEEAS